MTIKKLRCVVCACGNTYSVEQKADHKCNYIKVHEGFEFEELIELMKKSKKAK